MKPTSQQRSAARHHVGEDVEHRVKVRGSERRGWKASCSCGYSSTYRAIQKGAVEAAVIHVRHVQRSATG